MSKAFEDLYIWQLSRELVNLIYDITDKKPFTDFSLKDQVRRASVSVLSNIAEGFERGTKDEFLYFLYIAKGSCGEVRAQLYIAVDRHYINKKDFVIASDKSKQTSAGIYKFIEGFKKKGLSGLRRKTSTSEGIQEKIQRNLWKQLAQSDDLRVSNIYKQKLKSLKN